MKNDISTFDSAGRDTDPPQGPRARSQGSARKPLLLIAALAAAVIVISCSTFNFTREEPADVPGATRVGMESCRQCHDDVVQDFKRTSHGQMIGDQSRLCEDCHGAGSKHIDTGEETDTVMPNDANCLACHGSSSVSRQGDKKTLMDWHFGSHKQAGVKCIDCHDPHSHAPKGIRAKPEFMVQQTDAASSLCLSCHQEMLGRISMPYHHPIREGAMGCTSCHDPHGNPSRQLLSKNEGCVKCHQAQHGLFAREHPPVTEDCSICHNPHGSPVPKMLTVGQPMLCLQCHSLADNRHRNLVPAVSPAALRDCTSCHGSIHGSDIDAYFRH